MNNKATGLIMTCVCLIIGDTATDDTNFSAGIGLGLNMSAVAFELEYTVINDDIDMVSLLVRF